MRGYFGIGAEGISKAMNVGGIFRTAHAFGASFVFTLGAQYAERDGGRADTSQAPGHVPFYSFPDAKSLVLPGGCALIGVELTEDAVELPSFHHPQRAAYVLGPERGSVSKGLQERCDFIVKIPTGFCVNVGIAAAIVMYDRTLSLGRFARRPVRPGGAIEPRAEHVFGEPRIRAKMDKFLAPPPQVEEAS